MKKLSLVLVLLISILSFSQPADTARKLPVCPVCHSYKDVIPIVYGKPATETIKRAERGECLLGGCVPENKHYYCKKDKLKF